MASKLLPSVHVYSEVDGLAKSLSEDMPTIKFIDIPAIGLSPEAVKERLSEAEILVSDPEMVVPHLHDLPNLKWMQSISAGVDKLFNELDKSKPYPKYTITRLGGEYGIQMSEYVVCHITNHYRHNLAMAEDQKSKLWRREVHKKFREKFRTLQCSSIGILGLGGIGTEIARACKSFGMTVWGLVRDSSKHSSRTKTVDVYKDRNQLTEILANCDIICSVLPSTTETRGMLSGNVLEVCKNKSPLFMNIGRGDLISEESIITALREKWISKAVLDVFEVEPLPATSALWDEPNVVITPHMAGVTFDHMALNLMEENYTRYVNKESLLYAVDWTKGY